jgi:hypothetical protein
MVISFITCFRVHKSICVNKNLMIKSCYNKTNNRKALAVIGYADLKSKIQVGWYTDIIRFCKIYKILSGLPEISNLVIQPMYLTPVYSASTVIA